MVKHFSLQDFLQRLLLFLIIFSLDVIFLNNEASISDLQFWPSTLRSISSFLSRGSEFDRKMEFCLRYHKESTLWAQQ